MKTNSLEVPDNARSVNARRDALAVATSDLNARHLGLVLFEQEVLVDVVHVGHVVGFRHVPDDDVTQVAAGDETLAVVVGRDGRHLAAVRLVDDVHWTTGLRVETADTTVAPTYRDVHTVRNNYSSKSLAFSPFNTDELTAVRLYTTLTYLYQI